MNIQIALAKLSIALIMVQVAYAAIPSGTYDVYPPLRPTEQEIWAMVPELHRIAACESTGDPNGTPRQFNSDGSILWGEQNSPTGTVEIVQRDCGILQINTIVHKDELERLNLDVCNSESDNVYYGFLLAQKRPDFSDWSASKGCWGGE